MVPGVHHRRDVCPIREQLWGPGQHISTSPGTDEMLLCADLAPRAPPSPLWDGPVGFLHSFPWAAAGEGPWVTFLTGQSDPLLTVCRALLSTRQLPGSVCASPSSCQALSVPHKHEEYKSWTSMPSMDQYAHCLCTGASTAFAMCVFDICRVVQLENKYK